MSDDAAERADRLFDEALDLPAGEREAFLAASCGDDPGLRLQVERLLDAVEDDDGLTQGGALQGAVAEDLARDLEAAEPSRVGQRLGHYRVVGELGRGGMAVVYLGERDTGDFEQRVAIKLLREEIRSPDAIRRFHQERQILARSSHPNVARLLDGGVSEDRRPYLAMELIDGEPIDRYCDARRLTVRERIELFLEAARAVEHAHRNLVVHRDVKPSNLLVTNDGHVKLLDFGIAKMLDDPGAAEVTRTELRALTPAFASPEQLLGEPITTATDVYQLGLLLYLLLTGCWPYAVDGAAALARAIADEEPTRPSAALSTRRIREVERVERPRNADDLAADRRTTAERLRRRLSGDLDTIVLECLRKQPERRYGTVAQLIDDLERHLDGRPISARPDSLAYRFRKLVGRHRLASAVAAAAFVVVVSLVVWDNARLAHERDRARREAAKATEVSRFLRGLFEVAAPTRSLGEAVTARELLDRGAERVRHDLAGQGELQAEMMTVIGGVYGELAFFEEGEALLEEAVRLRRLDPGDRELDLADTLAALGELHERNKDLAAARRELDEALTLRRAALGATDPDVARTESRLGAVLVADGEIDAGRALLEQAVAALEVGLGPDHPDLGRALTELGVALRDQRDYEASIPVYHRARAILDAALGSDHPDAVKAGFNLAYSLRHTGDTAGSERLYLESRERYARIYGPQHPRVALAANNYSLLLRDLERWDEAIAEQERAIAIWAETLGPEHIQVAWGYNNLGVIAERRGDPAAALAAFRRSLEITERAVEPGHAELHVPLQNVGRTLAATGRPGDAVPYFLSAMEIRERIFGPEHSFVGKTCHELGEVYLALGRLDDAERVLRRAIAIGVADGRARDHRVTEPTVVLARTLVAGGRRGEAEALLRSERESTGEEGRAWVDAALADLPRTAD